jgi:hypothetical protein
MVRRLARALQVLARHPAAVGDRLRCPGLHGAGHGRLLGPARPPTGPLDGGIDPDRAMTLGAGVGTPADASQAIEPLLDGARADRLLGDGDLFPHRGKQTVPPHRLAHGTEAGTAGRQRALLRQSALLFSKGHRPHREALDAVYRLAGVRLAGVLTPMLTPLHGAKTWQLRPERLEGVDNLRRFTEKSLHDLEGYEPNFGCCTPKPGNIDLAFRRRNAV